MSREDLIEEVEGFINTFDGARDNFLNGNCYWFAEILAERFWRFYMVDIVYNQVANHFAAQFLDEETMTYLLFDASGYLGKKTNHWRRWDEYVSYEPYDAARVYKDCVWHMSDKKWEKLKGPAKAEPWNAIFS